MYPTLHSIKHTSRYMVVVGTNHAHTSQYMVVVGTNHFLDLDDVRL